MIYRDYLWKAAFRAFIKDFIEFFFPEKYDQIDWSKGVEFLDKELNKLHPKSPQKNRMADVLVRLYLKNGEIVWVLLHIEVQGYTDNTFGQRMHQMRYRIEDLFGVNPAMLAIFTDDDSNFHPMQYEMDTWGASCRTVFLTYKVMDIPPSTFPIRDSAVALLMEIAYNAIHAKQLKDEDIIKLHLPLVKNFLTKGYTKYQIKTFLSFVEGYIKFENSNNSRIFEEKIDNMVKYETTEVIYAQLDREMLKYKKKMAKLAIEQAQAELKQEREKIKETQIELKQEREKIKETQIELKQEREKTKQEREKTKQEREKTKQEREKAEQSILLMLSQGIDKQLITKILKMTLEEIQNIEIKYKDKNPLNGSLNEHA